MSVRAEVKTESTAENEMSNKEVSSPLSSSDSEAVVPQSLGEHQIDMEESKHSGVAQNIEQHINKKSAKDSASESEVGSCKSQNLRTVECIESIYFVLVLLLNFLLLVDVVLSLISCLGFVYPSV